LKIQVLWDVTQCHWVNSLPAFRIVAETK